VHPKRQRFSPVLSQSVFANDNTQGKNATPHSAATRNVKFATSV